VGIMLIMFVIKYVLLVDLENLKESEDIIGKTRKSMV
jgi:hypothetical protein